MKVFFCYHFGIRIIWSQDRHTLILFNILLKVSNKIDVLLGTEIKQRWQLHIWKFSQTAAVNNFSWFEFFASRRFPKPNWEVLIFNCILLHLSFWLRLLIFASYTLQDLQYIVIFGFITTTVKSSWIQNFSIRVFD